MCKLLLFAKCNSAGFTLSTITTHLFLVFVFLFFSSNFVVHFRQFVVVVGGTCHDGQNSSNTPPHSSAITITAPPLSVDFTVCKKLADPSLRHACIMRLQFWLEARKAEKEGRIVPASELPPPSQGLGLPTYRKATQAEKATQLPLSVASERYGCLNTSCLCNYMKEQCVSTNVMASQLLKRTRQRRQSADAVPEKALLKRCKRKEYRMLDENERARVHAAMLQLKNGHGSHEYDRLSFYHFNPALNPSAHGGPTFLLWHREYLKRFEIALRAIDSSVCLPYWDVTLDQRLPKSTDSVMWSDLFMGAPDSSNKHIADGFLANWLTSTGVKIRRDLGLNGRLLEEKEVLSLLTAKSERWDFFFAFTNGTPASECTQPIPDVEDSQGALELIHNFVHSWVGGHMTRLETSTEDPIFFLYHAFLDYIWEHWRQLRQTPEQRETQFPPDSQIVPCSGSENYRLSATMYPFQDPVVLNAVGLSNEYTDNLYTYDPRPTCTMTNGCGSFYLFCDTTNQHFEGPICCAKIKPGGDCSIFQNNLEEPCFDSTCTNGVCVSVKATPIVTETSSTTPIVTETSSTTPIVTETSSTTPIVTETSSTTPIVTETSSTTTVATAASATTTLLQFTPNITTSSVYTNKPATCCCVCRECDETQSNNIKMHVLSAIELMQKRERHNKPRCAQRASAAHRPPHKQKSTSSSSGGSSESASFSSSEEKSSGGECGGKRTVGTTTTTTVSPPQTTKLNDRWGSTTPSPTPSPPKQRVCYDGHECCAHWATKGACKSAPRNMNTWCPGTCQFNGCRPHPKQSKRGCSNLYSECHRWAHYHEGVVGINECERNPHWMAQNCAKACRKCGVAKPDQCIQNMPQDYEAPPINDY